MATEGKQSSNKPRFLITSNASPTTVTIQHRPVDVRVLQVERLAGVISQDEGEHGVLHEVVEGAARVLVEVREVLEVRDLTRAPELRERCDVSVLQQVGQVRGQDVVVDVVTELKREHEEKREIISNTEGNMEKDLCLLVCCTTGKKF